jgi:hypothetical protein
MYLDAHPLIPTPSTEVVKRVVPASRIALVRRRSVRARRVRQCNRRASIEMLSRQDRRTAAKFRCANSCEGIDPYRPIDSSRGFWLNRICIRKSRNREEHNGSRD